MMAAGCKSRWCKELVLRHRLCLSPGRWPIVDFRDTILREYGLWYIPDMTSVIDK